jgi:predicted RNase H-like nuclease
MRYQVTNDERERLEDEWLECNRRLFDEHISLDAYWSVVERCREIDAMLRDADRVSGERDD